MPTLPKPLADAKYAAMREQLRRIIADAQMLLATVENLESPDPKQRQRCKNKHPRQHAELIARVRELDMTTVGRR